MFSTMDIASGGNQQMHVLRSNQQHHHQQQAPPQQQQQVFQYGGYQQQQQQQPYFTAYPNACTQPSNNPPQQQQKPGHNNNVGFMQTNSYAMQPQQQMFPYGYQQPNSYMPPRQQLPVRGGGYNPNINHHHSGGYGQQQGPPHGSGRGRGRGGYNAFVQHYHQVHNNFFYNQQHHFSSNNAVPEKTPTLLVTHPTTKKVMSIKLNRIYSTMADLRPQLQQQRGSNTSNTSNANPSEGSTAGETPSPSRAGGAASLALCLDFLSPRGCVHGSGCDKVHVAGLEYMWDPIEVTVVAKDDVGVYTKGFRLHCYDPSLAKYYNIPSEFIEVTKGSADYVTMYNEHGDNFKTKFKVCAAILAKQACENGPECSDIHCSLEGLTGAEELHSHATHINNAEGMQSVTRLPADMKVRVFDQNSANTFHDYMGTNVLLTEGAKTYAKYYMQELNKIPVRKRMQHCAHFRLKDMCRLGESCRFLHVLPTPEEIQQRLEREHEAAKAEELQEVQTGDEENF